MNCQAPLSRCLVTWALLCLWSAAAQAQSINVTTPRLPARTDAAAANSAQPQAATPQANAYANPAAQGAGYANSPQQAAAPAVMPQRAGAGLCRAQPTPDRQTLVLVVGPEALARTQIPLGEFRAQQVVHSPDGRWAVAYTKLRGAAQFAAITIDLERCESQRVIELPKAGEEARFEGDDVVLQWAGGERRSTLRDGRVR